MPGITPSRIEEAATGALTLDLLAPLFHIPAVAVAPAVLAVETDIIREKVDGNEGIAVPNLNLQLIHGKPPG
jgi:hypothetical protein